MSLLQPKYWSNWGNGIAMVRRNGEIPASPPVSAELDQWLSVVAGIVASRLSQERRAAYSRSGGRGVAK